jgi:hypothetical protein
MYDIEPNTTGRQTSGQVFEYIGERQATQMSLAQAFGGSASLADVANGSIARPTIQP